MSEMADRENTPTQALPDYLELAAYFVVSDVLGGVPGCSRARHPSVAATRRMGRLTVEVTDDGGPDGARGARLRRLRERLTAIGGRLEVETDPDGTTVRASIPCAL
jgi:signal transduction histidine kinase